MRALAGIGRRKKATRGATLIWAVFCGTKLKKMNEGVYSIIVTLCLTKSLLLGIEAGGKTTLRGMLQSGTGELKTQFKALSDDARDALLSKHLEEKENKENVPKRLSQAAVSTAVYSQMELITATVSARITSLTCF